MMSSASSTLSERFRRAIQDDELATAKRIYDRAQAQGAPFDIRNQTLQSANHHENGGVGGTAGSSMHSAGLDRSAHHHHATRPLDTADALGGCLALSASQLSVARQSRLRERNREAARAKSSLAIAVEGGASIELVQWLLDMGHERGDFSRDVRGCTVVSLASQHNRTDVIEACCIDAVAHAATLHHQRSLMYGFNYMSAHPFAEEDEEDDVDVDSRARPAQKGGDESVSLANGQDDASEGTLSPALTLVTAAASTPSRRPSPNPVHLARHLQQQHILQQRKEQKRVIKEHVKAGKGGGETSNDEDDDQDDELSSIGGSSEMDDIVGVTIQRLVDCPDELGRTGLSLASMKGYEDVVKLLMDLGAALDLGDYEGNRPLHYASAYNQLIIVQLLIERGCSYSLQNLQGFTAADYAWSSSLKSALEAFARAQFDAKRVRNRNGQSSSTMTPNHGLNIAAGRDSHEISSKPSSSNAIGLFPAPLRSAENSLPSSPQLKLSSQLRDIF